MMAQYYNSFALTSASNADSVMMKEDEIVEDALRNALIAKLRHDEPYLKIETVHNTAEQSFQSLNDRLREN